MALFYQVLLLKPVGRWSAGEERITVSADDMDLKIGFMGSLQVPPRAPKNTPNRKIWGVFSNFLSKTKLQFLKKSSSSNKSSNRTLFHNAIQ